MPLSEQLNIRLESELKAQLQKLAEADERNLSNYIAKVLRAHVAVQKKKR